MEGKRKAIIEKGITLIINLGNYENVHVHETIKVEVEFSDAAELEKKNLALTQRVLGQAKVSAEQTLKELKRTRVVNDQPAELW